MMGIGIDPSLSLQSFNFGHLGFVHSHLALGEPASKCSSFRETCWGERIAFAPAMLRVAKVLQLDETLFPQGVQAVILLLVAVTQLGGQVALGDIEFFFKKSQKSKM